MDRKDETVNEEPINLDQEVDLFEYLYALLAAKYRILLIAAMIAISVFAYSKTIDDKFSATARVAVNINSEPGGVAPKNYRAGNSLSLLEYDLLINPAADNEMQRLLARMKSAAFSEIFVKENNLIKYIYKENWDEVNNAWSEGFKPSITDAVLYFRRNMRSVNLDQATSLLDISFITKDPNLSSTLANRFVKRFNKYIQEMEASEIAERRRFLEQRLDETSNLEIQRSIYRMLETQLASEALIFAKKEYPLEEIQPALTPQFKSSPKRKTWAILSFVGTTFAGIVAVLTWVIISKMKNALKKYNHNDKYQDTKTTKKFDKKNTLNKRSEKNQSKHSLNSEKFETIDKQARKELDEWLE